MSNAEDLNRLTACSLVLLGHIFYVLGNHRVRAKHMTNVPDVHIRADICLVLWIGLNDE